MRAIDIAVHHFDPLKVALSRLTNEVAATLWLAPEGLRELIGNTNFSILELRVNEAREALAAIDKERNPTS